MTRYNQQDSAILRRGFEVGGFPISRRRFIKLFNQNTTADFDQLKERMRSALIDIEHDNMTMEQISSAAHICAVVAYKLTTPPIKGKE